MAHLSARLLLLGLLLWASWVCSAAPQDGCTFLGEEETSSFYQEGDVVLGGLFPLHYSPVSSVTSFQWEPQQTTYDFSARALRWMETMMFAVKEINQRRDLLPHLTLGFHIRDSCDHVPVSLRGSLLLVNGQPEWGADYRGAGQGPGSDCAAVRRAVSPVIIGDAASGVSMAVLRTLGSFQIPLVSYFASCSCLSDQKQFPTFMRTMPSDAFQIRALARLVRYFHWTWVGVIGVESDYARFAIQLFLQESVHFGMCAAYVHFYPVVLTQHAVGQLVDTIQGSSSRVLLNFSGESELRSILRECLHRNVTGLQLIASEAWATSKSLWREFGDLLTGTLGFGIRKADVIPGLKDFLTRLGPSHGRQSAFLAEFWEETFNCRVNDSLNTHTHSVSYLDREPCSGREVLGDVYTPFADVSQLRVSYNVYKAVYLIAHALQDMTNCVAGQGPFINGTCGDPKHVKPWQLLHYMKQVKFSTLGEEVSFDHNGDPIASYDLMNWQRGQDGSLRLVKVGFYDASLADGRDLVINESVIQWPVGKQAVRSVCSESCPPGTRVARKKGEPVCCFDCIPCAEGEVSNQTDSLNCIHCSDVTWPNEARDHCVPKTIEFLSYQESMGVVLCVVSILGACASLSVLAVFVANRHTPIVRGNNMELSFLLLLFLSICFLIGLLFIGEPSDWLCRIRYPAFGVSFALCISCLLAKTMVVLMAFRATLPGSDDMRWFGPAQQRASVVLCTAVQGLICLTWLLTRPPYTNLNTGHISSVIIVDCAMGSEVAFWCVLGYIGLLACMCFILAFLARKLPDNFNEAKFITFSMLIFFAVWITFIPVYVSTAGKYTVAVHVFAILASAFGLLVCIFAPKCYIVVLRPEKNSRKHMMLKG
ncbi:extracellular calcium-sensing receptor-like [Oncorhynchus masou masou]|uniref:extracellular calcium-sensing receptor-like n=1 Tax=Oncorhynchus masou masou TaxID=90313 RepID=UPI0031844B1A